MGQVMFIKTIHTQHMSSDSSGVLIAAVVVVLVVAVLFIGGVLPPKQAPKQAPKKPAPAQSSSPPAVPVPSPPALITKTITVLGKQYTVLPRTAAQMTANPTIKCDPTKATGICNTRCYAWEYAFWCPNLKACSHTNVPNCITSLEQQKAINEAAAAAEARLKGKLANARRNPFAALGSLF
jgi:hypothetical protein